MNQLYTICYNENPLKSKIILTEMGSALFMEKIRVNQLRELIGTTRYKLKNKDYTAIDELVSDLSTIYIDTTSLAKDGQSDKSEIEQECVWLHDHLKVALTQTHAGDCCRLPGPCTKCYAEELLGSNSISGLGSIEASLLRNLYLNLDGLPKNDKQFFKIKKAIDVLDQLSHLNPNKPDLTIIEMCINQDWVKRGYAEYKKAGLVEKTPLIAQSAFNWLKNYKEKLI